MRIGRTLPPAATPISFGQIMSGIAGIFKRESERERFRSELKEYFGARHVLLVSSGKAALALTLEVLKELNPGRRFVIIPAFTCYSVPSAIKRAGLGIELCDIDPDTLDFDYAQLEGLLREQKIAHNALAVIPRHIFGIAADVDRLKDLVRGKGIAVVEDAAQTMGDSIGDQKQGTLGDAGLFSLGRGKAFSTVEGGVILTNRQDIGEKLQGKVNALPEYGLIEVLALLTKAVLLSLCMHPLLFWIPKSLPFLKVGATIYDPSFHILRLSGFQVGVSRGWVAKLQKSRELRKRNAKFWVERIKKVSTTANLFKSTTTGTEAKSDNSPVRFPVVFENEPSTTNKLKLSEANGLGVMLTYPESIDGIPELSSDFKDKKFPNASDCSRRILTFPTHAYVTQNDKERIITTLKLESA